MTGQARFEANEGWVAVSPDGAMWRHRGRGSVGVLVFERTESGAALYQATHQDCYSQDTSLTTESWREAVRFAMEGRAAALSAGVEPPARVEP